MHTVPDVSIKGVVSKSTELITLWRSAKKSSASPLLKSDNSTGFEWLSASLDRFILSDKASPTPTARGGRVETTAGLPLMQGYYSPRPTTNRTSFLHSVVVMYILILLTAKAGRNTSRWNFTIPKNIGILQNKLLCCIVFCEPAYDIYIYIYIYIYIKHSSVLNTATSCSIS